MAGITELRARMARLRIQQKEVATLAELDESTVARTFAGKTVPLLSTMQAIEQAIEAEERRLLKYLERLSRTWGGQAELGLDAPAKETAA